MNKTSAQTLFYESLISLETLFMEVGTNRMKKEGIRRGDIVMMDTKRKPKPGEMAVCEEDGERKLRKAKGEGVEWKVIWVMRKV
ncbi:MAG: S24 family peptidase [Haliscomenobacter sp.]|uniref:S24 family peptidase n=1 Tax=Haliscomenobacter sp. TaxID=2717303 RepID=UPI0029BEE67A|nr:S24 family peptidase [Haliscomenobacter sp.]MDX2069990.1 S24 family peptidase [Haliscomenobacter sp.]